MPLSGDIEVEGGVTASYHVIAKILAWSSLDKAVITLEHYRDKQALTNGKLPLQTDKHAINNEGSNDFNTYLKQSVLQEAGKDPISQSEKYLAGRNSTYTIQSQ
jgi:hypothetical protein